MFFGISISGLLSLVGKFWASTFLSLLVILLLLFLARRFRVLSRILSHSTITRKVALYTSIKIGRMRYWMKSEWIPPVFLLVATAIIVWVIKGPQQPGPQIEFGRGIIVFLDSLLIWLWNHSYAFIIGIWADWLTILPIYTLILLSVWVWRARKRVVIEEFADYTSEQPKAVVDGLATLLVVRLGQLRDLYRTVDEQRAIPTSVGTNQSVDATINVGDVSEFLKDAVTAQSELGLGPLKIPVGTLMLLLGRFAQGPRIVGSLHKDKDLLILIAQRVDGKQSSRWRVEGKLPMESSGQQENYNLSGMIDELACRMFTDLALNGSVLWSATAKFNDGLRSYRDCLRSPKERKINLQQAEKKFIETLAEDQKFKMAYYNLGVVYTELGQNEAAADAFLNAIKQNPGSWNAYYALALINFENPMKEHGGKMLQQGPLSGSEDEVTTEDGTYKIAYTPIIELCKRVIELKPGMANTAKAYQLRALSQERLRQFKLCELNEFSKSSKGSVADRKFKGQSRSLKKAERNSRKDATHSRFRAIGESWRALCAAELKGRNSSDLENSEIVELETLAGICLANQAVASIEGRWFRYAEKLFKEALSLTHAKPDYYAYYYYELGETYFEWGKDYNRLGMDDKAKQKYRDALKEYKHAVRIDPVSVEFRTSLARGYAELDDEESALDECEKVLSKASVISRKAWKMMEEVYCRIGKSDTWLKVMEEFLRAESELRELEEEAKEGKIPVADFKKMLNKKLQEYTSDDKAWGFALVTLAMGRLGSEAYKPGYLKELYNKAINKLNMLCIRYDSESYEWERGQLFRILGYLYLELDKPDQAEDCFRKAIEAFEKNHSQEIRLQKLRLWLARSLLRQEKQEKNVQALQELKRALSHDSLEYDEREVLGDVYFKLDEFEEAIETWKDALTWRNALLKEPDSAHIKYKIGNANVELARHCFKPDLRDAAYEEAVLHLKQALRLYDSDQHQQRGLTCYLLGSIYLELGKYWEAISFLKMSQALGHPPLTSTFYLGYAYLKNREYYESIKQFEILLAESKRYTDAGESDDALVEIEQGVMVSLAPITLAEFKALAHWGQAFAIAECDGNLKKAQELIESAEITHILELNASAQTQINALNKITPIQIRFSAKYYDCKGWIYYKLGSDIEKAIECLECALTTAVDAEIYLHLALANEQRLQTTREKCYLDQAKVYCQHARELDHRLEYDKLTSDLLQRLQQVSQEMSSQKQKSSLIISNGNTVL